MSFLFPRRISISRPNADTGLGIRPYGGLTETNETSIAISLPARIQSDRQGTAPQARLPADAAGQSIWLIIFKGALGLTQTGDIITDDLGQRYQVISAYWGPLVTTCRCQIEQT